MAGSQLIPSGAATSVRLMKPALVLGLVLACAAVAMSQTTPANGGAAPGLPLSQFENQYRSAADRLHHVLLAVIAWGNHGHVSVGTGFFIDEHGTFLTAAHVLDPQPGVVRFGAYYPFGNAKGFSRIQVISLDRERDIAVCRMVLDNAEASALPPFEYLPLAKGAAPAPGTFVAVAGFPLGSLRPIFQFGTVASLEEPGGLLQVGLMLNDGDSGGPVIEVGSGALVGMVVSVRTTDLYEGQHSGQGQQNSGLSWVLPGHALLTSLQTASNDSR